MKFKFVERIVESHEKVENFLFSVFVFIPFVFLFLYSNVGNPAYCFVIVLVHSGKVLLWHLLM